MKYKLFLVLLVLFISLIYLSTIITNQVKFSIILWIFIFILLYIIIQGYKGKITPDNLILISGLIIIIPTVGFGLVIPSIDDNINDLQEQIDNKTSVAENNFDNVQQAYGNNFKIATLRISIIHVLEELNSSYVKDETTQVKRELSNAIQVMSQGKYNIYFNSSSWIINRNFGNI